MRQLMGENVRLKRLAVIGFKSFASKTVFEFGPGMTSIVGPNGCGKSNIADALRWVLGEQSAKDLRGDLMEDVIFNGTLDAKPLGMAEVSLTLVDENDKLGLGLHEVVVSRRLFRSGESQYLINKKQCRLRDVLNLFFDTGIGLDSYSHFEQGKIDQILSSKPVDRRQIFEEAAGIMKYKKDKRTALRKLEATEDNLTRINDIIREIKRQINSINRQAGKARRYKRILEELAEIEVGLLVRNRDKMLGNHSDLEKKHVETRSSIDDTKSLIESKEEEIDSRRHDLSGLELEYERLQGTKLDTLRNIDREKNNISLCEERIEDAKDLDETGRRQIEELTASIAALNADLAKKREELVRAEAEREECATELAAREQDISSFAGDLESVSKTLEDSSLRSMELIRAEAGLENQIEALARRKEENTGLLEKTERECEALGVRHRELKATEMSVTVEKTAFEERLQEFNVKVTSFGKDIEERNRKRDDNRRQIQELGQKQAQTTSQYNLLRSMQDTYEGYSSGVKTVLRESASGEGALTKIHGVVADVIKVGSEYETAIEAALGSRVQNIITGSGQAAEQAIQLLKRENAGRATFLALDILREQDVPVDEARELTNTEPAALGLALDFVSCDPIYTPVIRFLLSRTVIVRDLETALNIARKKRYNLSLVTLDGEIVSRRGAISGGSAPNHSSGLLMREAHTEELAKQKERLVSEIDKLSGLDETIGALLFELEREQAEIAKSIAPLRDKIREKETNTIRLSAMRDSLDKESASYTTRIQQLKTETQNADRSRQELHVRLTGFKNKRVSIATEMKKLKQSMAGAEEKKAALTTRLTELKVKSASLAERENFLRSTCERLEEELKERAASIESKRNEILSSGSHAEELARNIAAVRKTIEELERAKAKTEQAIELVDEQRGETVSALTASEEELKRNRLLLNTKQEEESEQKIKIAEIRFAINGIDDRLRNEYKLTADDPRARRLPDDTNWEEIEARIEDLKNKKETIGEVNLFAIEEQERLQERHDLLVEQQNDLIQAKESLLKAISKINTQARKLFRETFDQIREAFKGQFTRLFCGGRADLILLDENDILECGIDIVASPPGKKLQNISLLSGGEKAMTAVALLFAIFRIKPSPFCILDEVDAALDDSNISRFTDVLREFLNDSQFIIITHNKRTIAMADVLYGITMEKSGISKVISVKFRTRHDPRQEVMRSLINGDGGQGSAEKPTEAPDHEEELIGENKTEAPPKGKQIPDLKS